MYKELAFIAYSVKDVPRAITFYRDVIGLKPSDMFTDYWAEFDIGDMTFGVGDGESIGIKAGSQASAAFEVDDVAAERERLVALGVPVTEVSDSPMCHSCFVTDPEGNRFALHQRKR
ncbi:MAG TPA: VOC family protein [Candidatus Eremiobacteraceae bacterium]|nr:VOC family protein [Candidatus Eremiobacteraceae bacterium]